MTKKNFLILVILRRIHTDTTRHPSTQVLQGGLDTSGEIFNRTLASILAGETEDISKKFNPQESTWGSHIRSVNEIVDNSHPNFDSRVLSAAALATSGDILEMGTGFFSTPMLHDIVSSKV